MSTLHDLPSREVPVGGNSCTWSSFFNHYAIMIMSSDSSNSLLSPGVWTTTGAIPERQERPSFSSSITSDRLRESEKWASTLSKSKSTGSDSGAHSSTRARKSAFKEIGLEDIASADATSESEMRSSTTSPANAPGNHKPASGMVKEEAEQRPWYTKLAKPSRPVIKSAASAPPATFSTFPRVAIIAFLIAIVIPGITYRGTGELNANVPADGVGAGPIGEPETVADTMVFKKRGDSPIDICTRWAHQSMPGKLSKVRHS